MVHEEEHPSVQVRKSQPSRPIDDRENFDVSSNSFHGCFPCPILQSAKFKSNFRSGKFANREDFQQSFGNLSTDQKVTKEINDKVFCEGGDAAFRNKGEEVKSSGKINGSSESKIVKKFNSVSYKPFVSSNTPVDGTFKEDSFTRLLQENLKNKYVNNSFQDNALNMNQINLKKDGMDQTHAVDIQQPHPFLWSTSYSPNLEKTQRDENSYREYEEDDYKKLNSPKRSTETIAGYTSPILLSQRDVKMDEYVSVMAQNVLKDVFTVMNIEMGRMRADFCEQLCRVRLMDRREKWLLREYIAVNYQKLATYTRRYAVIENVRNTEKRQLENTIIDLRRSIDNKKEFNLDLVNLKKWLGSHADFLPVILMLIMYLITLILKY